MKTLLALLVLIVAGSTSEAAWKLVASESLDAPAGLRFERKSVANDGARAELHVVTFSPKTHTLAVMDNPAGDFTLATAAQKRGALVAVNGGYFHPDRTPLGLVVRQGASIHSLERAKLLSGLIVARRDGIAILRAGEFKQSAAVREALQAGPFLVDGGKAVAGLNATCAAARTVVFADRAGRCGLLTCRFTTLAETAEILSSAEIFPAGKITRALNLDGGSSTGMWVRTEPPFYQREGRDVRNYLGIVAK